MKARWVAAIVVMSTICGGCSRGAEVRFRVSYTVDDNGTLRSANGVWSQRVFRPILPLASNFGTEFHGEAIPLALPGRGVLLLLPIDDTGDNSAGGMVRTLFNHRAEAPSSDLVGQAAEVAQMVGQLRGIRCERYGTPPPPFEPGERKRDDCLNFAFIANPNDQSTFRRQSIFERRFGLLNGVRLLDARVTITHEPVTRGLEKLLPWLPGAQEYWRNTSVRPEDRRFYAFEIIQMRK